MTYAIAVVGATGLVGTTLLNLLAERSFPIKNLCLLASSQSAGKEINFQNKNYRIHDLSQFDFKQADFAFFCVGNDLAKQYAPKAAASGCIVIDKSYYFRNHDDIPLVVPEVNHSALLDLRNRHIIASPNCSTIPLAVALKPIYDAVGITRINVATYQSVSGTGKDAIQELTTQTRKLLADETFESAVYPQQIAFNILPHIDNFQDNGYTLEEMKIVLEMQKIFNDRALRINPTAVRVPVFCGHAASVHLETKSKIGVPEVIELLRKAPGIKLVNGVNLYPTPVRDAAGKDEVCVGRIREDISHPLGVNLWIVADNLRKGAALNAIQIAEYLIKHHL